MFIIALFTITNIWKQPKCLSTDEWIKKWYRHTMEYYSALRKKETMPFAATWKDLEIIILSSSIHGILQARIQERVAMPSSRESSQPRAGTQVSHVAGGFSTVWTTREAQEQWSGESIPSPGKFLTQELKWDLLRCRRILYIYVCAYIYICTHILQHWKSIKLQLKKKEVVFLT